MRAIVLVRSCLPGWRVPHDPRDVVDANRLEAFFPFGYSVWQSPGFRTPAFLHVHVAIKKSRLLLLGQKSVQIGPWADVVASRRAGMTLLIRVSTVGTHQLSGLPHKNSKTVVGHFLRHRLFSYSFTSRLVSRYRSGGCSPKGYWRVRSNSAFKRAGGTLLTLLYVSESGSGPGQKLSSWLACPS